MQTNVLDIDVEYVIMIPEHTFERGRESGAYTYEKQDYWNAWQIEWATTKSCIRIYPRPFEINTGPLGVDENLLIFF